MIVTPEISAARQAIESARARGLRVGLVPTMGALHVGHTSLMDAARAACDFVAVSIFVNPTQFGPHEDFHRYPRPLEDDLALCQNAGVDLVFHPTVEAMYPQGFATSVDVEGLSTVLEGAHRPGHFRGVTTVVLKLFEILPPHVAFFGRKDYQQQLIIRRMCRDLDLPIEVETCPTIREPDGLAMSSRNRYLSPEDRQTALLLSQALRLAESRLTAGERNVSAVAEAMQAHLKSSPRVELDYAIIAHPETLEALEAPRAQMVALIAARVGTTRLIDNLPIEL